MTEKEKMIRGELYAPGDPVLLAARMRARALCRRYNQMEEGHWEEREALTRELFGAAGADPYLCLFNTNPTPRDVEHGRLPGAA